VGVLLVLITSLFGIPQPLIIRYLVDDVILGRQLGLLAIAVILLAGISLAEKLTDLLQQFYFARFVQEVTLDIQEDLFSHVLRFLKGSIKTQQIRLSLQHPEYSGCPFSHRTGRSWISSM